MKKPFKNTVVGKIVGGLAKGVTKSVPIIGDVVENVTSEDGGKGKLDYVKLVTQIIRLVTFSVLVYEFVKGNISLDMITNF